MSILVDWSVKLHQLRLKLCQGGLDLNRGEYRAKGVEQQVNQPSGLSQILAASGLSGEALLGSKAGIH